MTTYTHADLMKLGHHFADTMPDHAYRAWTICAPNYVKHNAFAESGLKDSKEGPLGGASTADMPHVK